MSADDPNLDELKILAVLVRVCRQFMPGDYTFLSHDFLSAGEAAVTILSEYGLMGPDAGGGFWNTRSQLLEQSEDYLSGSTVDDIKRRLAHLDIDEPLTRGPNNRPKQPDVQIEHLRLWFPSRAKEKYSRNPKLGSAKDPNRLDVEVRLEPVLALSTLHGEILTVAEVRDFRTQLQQMQEASVGDADLVGYKDSLEIRLTAKADGGVTGMITVRHPNFGTALSSDVTRLKLSQVPRIIESLDAVLIRYPLLDLGT